MFSGADAADNYSGYLLKYFYRKKDRNGRVYEKLWYAEINFASYFDEIRKLFPNTAYEGVSEIIAEEQDFRKFLQQKKICALNNSKIYKTLPHYADERTHVECDWQLYPFVKENDGTWRFDKDGLGIKRIHYIQDIQENRSPQSDTWTLRFVNSDPMTKFEKKPKHGFGFIDWDNQKMFWIYPGYYQKTTTFDPAKEDRNERMK